MGYGQQAGGKHPTGNILFCLNLKFLQEEGVTSYLTTFNYVIGLLLKLGFMLYETINQPSCGEVNVFNLVCLSVNGGIGFPCDHHP